MNNSKPQALKVTEDKRFLITEVGTPFFWLGDTAWELFHKLNREEAVEYLQNRRENGFNVIQAVALAELDGLATGNAYGRRPLLKNSKGQFDPTLPDTIVEEDSSYTYWDHVDYIVDRAEEMGLYIGLLPTWGDKFNLCWGKGPVIFDRDNSKVYGKWLGERYKDRTNIIWILGGDRPMETSFHFNVVNAMAEGIKEGDKGKFLMTFHPMGGVSSSKCVHHENWLDFNLMQSGHGALNIDNYAMIGRDYGLLPTKPTLDGEPRYEDHPINFNPTNGYFDDFDVRQAAYWAVFAGAFGHTYGHHSIWCMCTEPADYFIMHWREALNQPGALQMKYIKALVEARPFLDSFPDQSLLEQNYLGANHIQALRGKDYAFLYSPNGLKMKVVMSKISGEKINAYWYDPRTGNATFIGLYQNSGVVEFTPPSSGRRKDWVLILDDEASNYPTPK